MGVILYKLTITVKMAPSLVQTSPFIILQIEI